jgi:DNA invertase Pin-like site-specific DNA recombinase
MMKGWQLAEVFVDAGVSGATPIADRQEGRRMLAAIKAGDVVIVAKLDRMFRSALDALTTLKMFQAKKVGLHMIDLAGDVTGNGMSKLMFTVISAFAEAERDRIGERIRDNKRNLAAQGRFLGGRKPFGFDIVGAGKEKHLVPNTHEQAALARMKTLRKRGKSLREIAETVAKEFNLKVLTEYPLPRVKEGRRQLWLRMDLDMAILPPELTGVRDVAEDL